MQKNPQISSFELKSRKFNINSIMLLIAFLMITVIFAIFIFPDAYQLYIQFPNNPEAKMPFQLLIIFFIGLITFFLLFSNNLLARKIKVEDSLVYFMKKNKLGFGKWVVEKIVDFSEAETINHREVKVFNGKFFITQYWLIFEMKNGKSTEFFTNGWDITQLKNLFLYLKGRFPKIKFNNFILRDSPEKISGIEKLIENK